MFKFPAKQNILSSVPIKRNYNSINHATWYTSIISKCMFLY